MTQNTLRFCLNLPGRLDQVRIVRAALARSLADCPVADQIILVADELCANAIAHTLSGWSNGRFAVHVTILMGVSVTVQVVDQGGPALPRILLTPGLGCGGRGLGIVQVLADAWGVFGDEEGRTVWARCGWHQCGSPRHYAGDGPARERRANAPSQPAAEQDRRDERVPMPRVLVDNLSAGDAYRSDDGLSGRQSLSVVGELDEYRAAWEDKGTAAHPSAAVGALVDGEASDLGIEVL